MACISPLREERTPSFKVNYQKDLWYDFGIGEGGTLLALIMRLERCSCSEAFEHLQHAAEGTVSLLAARICERYAVPTESPNSQPALRIREDAPLRHPALLGYLAPLGIDAAVLNSVVNLPKALPFLERHPTIHAFLDNDEAGRRTLAELIQRCPRSRVIDHAHLYQDYKDLNDFWIASKRFRDDSEEVKSKSRKPQLRPKGGMKV